MDPIPVPTSRRAHDQGRGRVLTAEEILQGSVNESLLLITSASRTATNYSDRQENLRGRGVIATINVTTAGTGSVTLSIQRYDPATGAWVDMLASAAVTTATSASITIYPGLTAAANSVASAVLPRGWRVAVTHNNANAITYVVGISTLA